MCAKHDSTRSHSDSQVLSELQAQLASHIPYQLLMNGDTAVVWAGIRILSHEEAEAVIAAIRAFYATTTPEQIEESNWARHVANCKQPSSDKPKQGRVYLLESGGIFKIGITTHTVPKRAAEIRRDMGLPETPSVVCAIETDDILQTEAFLHSLFATKRLHGEWFLLDPRDVEYIKSLGGAA